MGLFEAHNVPFAAALVLMLLLAIMQIVGLSDLFGADADLDLDADLGADPGADFNADMSADGAAAPGVMDGMFSLMGLGRVPLTVWIALFLMLFAGVGFGLQQFAENLAGTPLNPWLAAILAGAGALPLTGALARPLGRILPSDETSAVRSDTLVGRRAKITEGVARRGFSARAKVRDYHGHAHYVMVEPHNSADELQAGEAILLVRREGNLFYGAPVEASVLSLPQ